MSTSINEGPLSETQAKGGADATTLHGKIRKAHARLNDAKLDYGRYCTVVLKELIETNSAPEDFVARHMEQLEEDIEARREDLGAAIGALRLAVENAEALLR